MPHSTEDIGEPAKTTEECLNEIRELQILIDRDYGAWVTAGSRPEHFPTHTAIVQDVIAGLQLTVVNNLQREMCKLMDDIRQLQQENKELSERNEVLEDQVANLMASREREFGAN